MEQEHKEFLDDLRESGLINMFAAIPSLQKEFGLARNEAKEILMEWMENYHI